MSVKFWNSEYFGETFEKLDTLMTFFGKYVQVVQEGWKISYGGFWF